MWMAVEVKWREDVKLKRDERQEEKITSRSIVRWTRTARRRRDESGGVGEGQ